MLISWRGSLSTARGFHSEHPPTPIEGFGRSIISNSFFFSVFFSSVNITVADLHFRGAEPFAARNNKFEDPYAKM